jgi:predicted nucleic acid-binding protein
VTFVLDASVTMAWFFDEPGPALGDLVDRLADEGAVVPRLWSLEVANVFRMAIRQKRTSAADRDAAFAELRRMGIAVDNGADELDWTTLVQLSDRYGLTIYDAVYLELAQRRRLPLATLDDELRSAASQAGIEALPHLGQQPG